MTPPTTTGEVDLTVPGAGKPCKTSYKVIGELQPGVRPLVALHGGPGCHSEYLLILSDITMSQSRPLIIYDQLGSGQSTHLPEKNGDTAFWTEQLFLSELDNLLTQLGIKDDYDLLGHSWGGMLAARHAITCPSGLRKLVVVSSPASMPLWVQEQNRLRKLLPADIQAVLTEHENAGTTDSKEYEDAVQVFYSRHLCVLDPMPAEVLRISEELAKDPTVYHTMNGPSEFHVIGSLKDWAIIEEAHKISVPTLLVNGSMDEATDAVVAPFFDKIPRVKWVTFAKSSHMAFFEERERFMTVVGAFLAD
ncbi:putative proline-specific peptidase [Lyophyllum shimeji]|uniref:Proline-specific peptidase n=1 Tax=Lyophyllum shimeji TaxID=47721 RepID=A0A9P3UJV0_LYOSH|nr:putative proline-specific peptidase [Lyophyllum shimeji]